MQPYNNALQIQRVGVLDFVHHEGREDGVDGTLQAGGLLDLQIQVTDNVLQGLEGSGGRNHVSEGVDVEICVAHGTVLLSFWCKDTATLRQTIAQAKIFTQKDASLGRDVKGW